MVQEERADPPFTAQDLKLPFPLFMREWTLIQVSVLSKEYRFHTVRSYRTSERLNLTNTHDQRVKLNLANKMKPKIPPFLPEKCL